ncbi:hypothetical protein RND71_038549 [Anisodus tanguticus]|uniref:Trichome birefringence-like N-terminal domain-containing protein n=1 Tax=Anisodus tanguticus TaxID=243964 RepID=A0AAE1R065_9SOLA|nr:hypothetical protein RND71_038549 [Anisodus tanguticus]
MELELLGNRELKSSPLDNPTDDRFEFDPEECSLNTGKWVFNTSIKPFYTDRTCPYVDRQYSCSKNGRNDSDYLHWEWKPDDCILPRFDPKVALRKIQGKRIMFVGDSIQRNMWESFVCLVQSVIPESQKSMKSGPVHSAFTAKEYNATIEFYWAPFLVESNTDIHIKADPKQRIIKVDSIAERAKQWLGVDILVFNTYVWWMSGLKAKALNEDWGNMNGIKCFNETRPVTKKEHWGAGSKIDMMKAVTDVIGRMKVPVTVLNITQLSDYRIDGHASLYGELGGKLLTDKQKADPLHFADCIHWCLPGVPDSWNRMLFAYL